MAGRRTREERETVIRFDDTDDLAYLSTASLSQARLWQCADFLADGFHGEGMYMTEQVRRGVWVSDLRRPDLTAVHLNC